ncbi:MAG: tRNA (adenosine(37)-N6)-threonylcarbamoyltransferase complex ATPase subunit type 1 TsaE [Gammaproteobacteria bacterium]|nr:tRNA (adenosine(37)-N6)-threonylcarbamoyltransferase complex ATPase subunit type 1 TsaE [Gammaproteobacteria bacterium]
MSEQDSKTLLISDDEAMQSFGAALAHACARPCVVYLIGELGTGKTTLVRGFLRALGWQGAVRSPTYTLVEQYELPTAEIYHLDLYRLVDPEELEFLGLRDWLVNPSILLVEWPQRGQGVLPVADLELRLDYADKGGRYVEITPCSDVGQKAVSKL